MAKVRIYQLAKELGMETQELLELLDQMGVAYKSHASTLEEKDAEAVRELVKEQRGLQEKLAEEERRKSLPGAPPWWSSWATWTTGRRPSWTTSAKAASPRRRPGGSPSTWAPLR